MHKLPYARHLCSLSETEAMVVSMLGKIEQGERLIQQLFDATGGNPLFIEEGIKTLIERGNLYQRRGVWAMSEDEEQLMLPESVEQIVRHTLELFLEMTRQVLRVAAVLGERFYDAALRDLWQGDCETLDVALLEASRKRIIEWGEEGESYNWRFAQPVLQKLLYREIPEPEREWLHRKAGAFLETQEDLISVSDQLTRHFFAAREYEKAVHYGLIAAKRCEEVYAKLHKLPYARHLCSSQ